MLSKLPNRCVSAISFNRRYASTSNLAILEELSAKAYQPQNVEKCSVYERWDKDEIFKPLVLTAEKKFSMVLPPPNVTGKLHLGHALGCTIQDVIVRRQRALGSNTLWVPGIDHAGIATQGVVEKYIKAKRGIDRQYLGRNGFNKEVWKWKEKYGNTIQKQLKQLGCSLDWSREVFTLDSGYSDAVNKAFIQLFDKGLIYRQEALVNWSNALQSTISDIEVDNMEIKGGTVLKVAGYAKPVKFGQMYSFAYKVVGSNEEVVVCTTMPETMLGDVAVAVHPGIKRYESLAGKQLYHPFHNHSIPIIFNEFVDLNFGTGAVKITPAHSKIDNEVAKRHGLPSRQVINEKGYMMNAGIFDNLHRYDARDKVVDKLAKLGSLRAIEPHDMTLPICSRSGDIIEYLPKEQWFVSCKKLNEKARRAVIDKELAIIPEKYVHNWLQWTGENSKDWCISRQLWWGHQIPAYKCTAGGSKAIWVAAENEEDAKKKAAAILSTSAEKTLVERDQDVLDTWFSSAIYPFTAMGWPNNCELNRLVNYNTFYPLNMMVTGHDILGFWVHRMVMLGLELTGKLPFEKVMLHGIICDSKGAKMSKSKGNVIDPTDVINGISLKDLNLKFDEMHNDGVLNKSELERALQYQKSTFGSEGIPECGVDALRFTLLSQDVKSHFVNFDVKMCHANKLFCNKIWQSVRYTHHNCTQLPYDMNGITTHDLTQFDRWILSRLARMVEEVNKYLENYDFHLATKALRKHIYNEFCDVFIEATKPGFRCDDIKTRYAHAHTLSAVLNTSLRCLNPFMVYLTEELIPKVPTFEHSIIYNYNDMNEKYYKFPKTEDYESWRSDVIEERVGKILAMTSLVREMKALCGMPSSAKPLICVKTDNENLKLDLVGNLPVILDLARCCALGFVEKDNSKNCIRGVLDKDSEILIEVLGDAEAKIKRIHAKLCTKIEKLQQTIDLLETKYATARYIESTPEKTKLLDVEKLNAKKEELAKLQTDISRLEPARQSTSMYK